MSRLQSDENRRGSRRDFLGVAGAGACGLAFVGGEGLAGEQDPKPNPPVQIVDKNRADGHKPQLRRSAPMKLQNEQLGPLRELDGVWVGCGFNLISLPDFDNPDGPQTFRLKLNGTREVLEFHRIGGPIPNRGSTDQKDINLFGVTYLQRISDNLTNEPLHIEPGLWLNVLQTTVPAQKPTVVRQGAIPHGTSFAAQGERKDPFPGAPTFKPIDSTPFDSKGTRVNDPIYFFPFNSAVSPPGFAQPFLRNPNLALERAIVGQNIVNTDVLDVSASNPTGICNIPFVDKNAKVTRIDSTFWIETIRPDGDPGQDFLQLQYTQTVILFFKDLFWPHISVATLLKQ
jgi:hypothetical protein